MDEMGRDDAGGDDAGRSDPDRNEAKLRHDLAEVEARISAVSTRLTLDYGSESTRDGWREWLAQLRRKRDLLQAELDRADDRAKG